MKFLILIFSVLIFTIISCNQYDRTNWTVFEGNGLKGERFNTLKFKNDTVGYFGGHKTYYILNDSGRIKKTIDSTALYKTNNQGKSWKMVNLHEKGSVYTIKHFGDTVCILNHQSLNQISSISISTNNGDSWEILFEFPKDNYVRDFRLIKDNGLLVMVSDSVNLNLLKINKRIDTLKKFSKYIYKTRIGSSKVYMNSFSGGNAYSNGITVYDYVSNNTNSVKFDESYSISSFSLNNDDLYITVGDKKYTKSKILKYSKNKVTEISNKEYSNYSINNLYVKDSLIFVNANKKENVGPIGVTHELLVSKDYGKNWNVENYPFSMYVEPADLLNNGTFITYQGLNRFQKRKTLANNSSSSTTPPKE